MFITVAGRELRAVHAAPKGGALGALKQPTMIVSVMRWFMTSRPEIGHPNKLASL
jgi:hypothetical protein